MLIVALIHDLLARSIDFVLAFPQADLDVPIFMELPPGIEPKDRDCGEYVFKLKKFLYRLRQESLYWFEKRKTALTDRGYVSSKVDPCLFYLKIP